MFPEYKVKFEYFFPLFADDLFCDLTPKALKFLNKIKQIKRLRKGFSLFSEGDFPCCVYILRKGKAQIFFRAKLNNIKIARSVKRAEILGLTEAIINLPYETEARTLTSCVFECFGRDEFIQFLQIEPDICFRLLQSSCLNLQKNRQNFHSQI